MLAQWAWIEIVSWRVGSDANDFSRLWARPGTGQERPSSACPLLVRLTPGSRHHRGHGGRSASCQIRTHALQQTTRHWMTWSARRRNDSEIVRPIALAVLRLITSVILVGCWTARSEGLVPFSILSTYDPHRERIIEKTFLRLRRVRTFSHSLGQKAKSSH